GTQRGGNLAADDAALAHACDNHASLADLQKLERPLEPCGHRPGEAVSQRVQGLGLGAHHVFARGDFSLGLFHELEMGTKRLPAEDGAPGRPLAGCELNSARHATWSFSCGLQSTPCELMILVALALTGDSQSNSRFVSSYLISMIALFTQLFIHIFIHCLTWTSNSSLLRQY